MLLGLSLLVSRSGSPLSGSTTTWDADESNAENRRLHGRLADGDNVKDRLRAALHDPAPVAGGE
jgi:hypothetical protein